MIFVRWRLTVFCVISVDARLVRAVDEIGDRCVVRPQGARHTVRRIGDLVATISRGSHVKICLFGEDCRVLRFPLREVEVAIVEYVMQILVNVRGGEYLHSVVFIAYQ